MDQKPSQENPYHAFQIFMKALWESSIKNILEIFGLLLKMTWC